MLFYFEVLTRSAGRLKVGKTFYAHHSRTQTKKSGRKRLGESGESWRKRGKYIKLPTTCTGQMLFAALVCCRLSVAAHKSQTIFQFQISLLQLQIFFTGPRIALLLYLHLLLLLSGTDPLAINMLRATSNGSSKSSNNINNNDSPSAKGHFGTPNPKSPQ